MFQHIPTCYCPSTSQPQPHFPEISKKGTSRIVGHHESRPEGWWIVRCQGMGLVMVAVVPSVNALGPHGWQGGGTSIPTVLIQELVLLKPWKTGIKIHQDLLSISTGILHTTSLLIYPSTISESHWAQWFWRDIMLPVNHHRMYFSWLKVSR